MLKRALLISLGAFVVAFGAVSLHQRSIDWWWAPTTLHTYGDRTYRASGEVLGREAVEATATRDLCTIDRLLLGQPIVAEVIEGLCPTVVYVRDLFGRYHGYSLAGGP